MTMREKYDFEKMQKPKNLTQNPFNSTMSKLLNYISLTKTQRERERERERLGGGHDSLPQLISQAGLRKSR